MLLQTLIGPPAKISNGATPGFRGGNLGDGIVSELHGRFYEQTYQGNLYSAGSSETALSANTVTLTATTTPIVGVWNPQSSPVNLVVLQAALEVTLQAVASTRQGAFVWAVSTSNAAITTGAAPWNRKTLTQNGSQAKAFNGGVALTGLSNNLVIMEGADLAGGIVITTTAVATTAATPSYAYVQNFDGNLIVPPGGVLALLNTVSTTNLSVASRLLWEEVPV